jgi:hypothetical protein
MAGDSAGSPTPDVHVDAAVRRGLRRALLRLATMWVVVVVLAAAATAIAASLGGQNRPGSRPPKTLPLRARTSGEGRLQPAPTLGVPARQQPSPQGAAPSGSAAGAVDLVSGTCRPDANEAACAIIIRSAGPTPLTVNGVTVSVGEVSNNCNGALPPGRDCVVDIERIPISALATGADAAMVLDNTASGVSRVNLVLQAPVPVPGPPADIPTSPSVGGSPSP